MKIGIFNIFFSFVLFHTRTEPVQHTVRISQATGQQQKISIEQSHIESDTASRQTRRSSAGRSVEFVVVEGIRTFQVGYYRDYRERVIMRLSINCLLFFQSAGKDSERLFVAFVSSVSGKKKNVAGRRGSHRAYDYSQQRSDHIRLSFDVGSTICHRQFFL